MIWRAAGDRAADFSWYTKRGVLVGVYVGTELSLLTDRSVEYENTWATLQRLVDNASTLAHGKNELGRVSEMVGDLLGALQRAGRQPFDGSKGL